jgi:PEP-CTERM motif
MKTKYLPPILAGLLCFSLQSIQNANAASTFYLNVVIDSSGDGFIQAQLLTGSGTASPVATLAASTTVADAYYQANPNPTPYVAPFNNLSDPLSYNLGFTPTLTGDQKIGSGTSAEVIRWYGNYLYFYAPTGPAGGIPKMLQTLANGETAGSMAGKMPSGLTISSGAQGYVYNVTSSSTPAYGFIGTYTADSTTYTIADVNYYFVTSGTVSTTPVPEPTSLALAGLGGLSLLLFRRQRK